MPEPMKIFPQMKGWTYDENLTLKHSDKLKSLVYSDFNIDTDFRLLVTNNKDIDRNVRIYARPDIDPFPVIQSWILVAEGKIDAVNDDIQLYSFNEKVNEVLQLLE